MQNKDVDKFMKYLALKAAQIIVQSRSGEKVMTKCRPESFGRDWFNLAVADFPDIPAEAKKMLSTEMVTSAIPLCIEVSLKTVEGDTMVLETWSLGVLPDQSDPTIRITYTVYNKMGILLKSLVSVSRVTPAYKLSRRQGPESYIICYRIHMGEPQLHTLGENYKQIKVGQLCTSIGTIHLSVSYRTKMAMSPTKSNKDSMILRSNHFHTHPNAKYGTCSERAATAKVLNSAIKYGALVSPERRNQITEKDLYPRIVFEEPLTCFNKCLVRSKLATESTSAPTSVTAGSPRVISQTSSEGAIPSSSNNAKGKVRNTNDNTEPKGTSGTGSKPRTFFNVTEAEEDFMLNWRPPFATATPWTELADFCRLFKKPAALQAFEGERGMTDLSDLISTLESFEAELKNHQEAIAEILRSQNKDEGSG